MKKLIFYLIIFKLAASLAFSQGTAINSNGAAPDNSALLDLSSTSQGFVMPRMTTAQMNAIVSPVAGLTIYNTDCNVFNYWNGSIWISYPSGAAGPPAPGSITGNSSPVCSAQSEVYSIAAVSGATGYNWNVPSGATINSGQGTTSVTVSFGAASGNICVTAVNACGTSNPACLSINLSGPSGVTASASPNPVCAGANLSLTGNATGATTWNWSGPNGFSSLLQNPTVTGITSAGAGIYSLSASNACGSATPVNTSSVTVTPLPAAPTAATHTATQTQITWNWNAVTGASGYQWNTVNTYPGTGVNVVASPTYTQINLSCNTAYTLYVWTYDGCGISSSTALTRTTSCCNLSSNLIAYWKMDETSGNAADASGNGYTLSNYNSVSFTSGKINNCADFGSSNNNKYLSTTNSTLINTNLYSNSYTVSVWANISTQPSSGVYYEIFGTAPYSGGLEKDIRIQYLNSSGVCKVLFNKGNYSGTDNNIYVTTTLATGTWHHFAFTYTNNTLLEAYIDGASVGYINNPYNNPAAGGSNNWLNVGSWVTPTAYLSGKTDEVGIWTRALSATEVSCLYNGGAGLQYPF